MERPPQNDQRGVPVTQRSLDDKIRVHVWLHKKDLERIAVAFPKQKQSEVIRTMVRKVLDTMEAQAGKARRVLVVEDLPNV